MAPDDPLPALSPAELETLLAALDPRLDGFGEGESCLDDALAYLARLGIAAPAPQESAPALPPELPGLIRWVESWRAAGGDRRTLRLMVSTLLAHGAQADLPADPQADASAESQADASAESQASAGSQAP